MSSILTIDSDTEIDGQKAKVVSTWDCTGLHQVLLVGAEPVSFLEVADVVEQHRKAYYDWEDGQSSSPIGLTFHKGMSPSDAAVYFIPITNVN